MSHTKPLTVSVVIPARNEERHIGNCIESILCQECRSLKEIIVVVNGSTDRTASIAERYEGVTVLRRNHALGLPAAREPGFLAATGDLIASLDADTQVSDGWFDTLEREFHRDRHLVCLSGPYRYREFPRWMYYLHIVLNCGISKLFAFCFGYRVLGGNFVIRRSVFEKMHTFGASTKFWGEDSEIGSHLHALGHVRYKESFWVTSSARRWQKEGFWSLGWKYLINLLAEGLFHHPAGYFLRKKIVPTVQALRVLRKPTGTRQ